MVDLPGRKIPRFPPEIADAVKGELAAHISYQVGACDKKDVKGFASRARGGDILFHEVCREAGIETVVVLPFLRPRSKVRYLETGRNASDKSGTRRPLTHDTCSVYCNPLTRIAMIACWILRMPTAPCSSSRSGMAQTAMDWGALAISWIA